MEMERKRRNSVDDEVNKESKKARLDKSDDEDYSDQEISIHGSYGDEFIISSPREEGEDTGRSVNAITNRPVATKTVEYIVHSK